MKKFFMFFLCTFLFATNLMAQAENEELVYEDNEREVVFVYIDHEAADAVDIISQRLKDMKDNADTRNEFSYIFYLANGENPIIVKYNIKGESPHTFNELLGELNNTIYHSVDPIVDMDNIIELLTEHDFLDSNGNLKYYSTTFDFYVGADFWTLGYHESIIAKLYFMLDVPQLKKMDKEFTFRINSFTSNYPKYQEGKPFGDKNLAGINGDIKFILEYEN